MDRVGGRRARWRALDVTLALGVFAYNLPVQGLFVEPQPGGDVGGVLALLVPVGLCAPWVVARARPVAALTIMVVAALGQLALGLGPLVADVMLVLGVYAVARRRPWTWSVPALVVVAGWAVVGFVGRLDDLSLTIGDLLAFVVGTVAAWLWGTLARTRAAYVESLHDRLEQARREQAIQARLATVAERTRIARELHDVVSHHLSAIGLLSDGAASTVAHDPDRAAAAMRTVRDSSRTALAEMRSMLSVLREDGDGSDAPAPAVADLVDLVESVRAGGLPARLTLEGDPTSLRSGLSLAAYRIAQEGLTNVARHAGPGVRDVEVAVHVTDAGVRVVVRDDGAGPRERVPEAPGDEQRTGHGLVGMRERVDLFHGTLRAGAGDDGGFVVDAWLPTPRPSPDHHQEDPA